MRDYTNPDNIDFAKHDEEYDIVYDTDIDKLIQRVNKKQTEEWRVHGTLMFDGERYYKEMTRYTPGMRKWKGGRK